MKIYTVISEVYDYEDSSIITLGSFTNNADAEVLQELITSSINYLEERAQKLDYNNYYSYNILGRYLNALKKNPNFWYLKGVCTYLDNIPIINIRETNLHECLEDYKEFLYEKHNPETTLKAK